MEKLMVAFLALGAIVPFGVKGADADVDVSFKPGAWNSNDWVVVKGPRWDYKHGFVQKTDCIENECPDVPGDVVYTDVSCFVAGGASLLLQRSQHVFAVTHGVRLRGALCAVCAGGVPQFCLC